MADPIVVAQGVKRRFVRGGEEHWALKGVDVAIGRGEFVAIMGPSGSGKSTLFNQIGALEAPTAGQVWFEGRSLFDLPEAQQAWIRCHRIGYVFQTFNLVPTLSAMGNVALPLAFAGVPRAEADRRAQAMLERVGLGHRLGNRPSELSGGQQQRVAVARALVNRPAVILADEPTGNLDTKTGTEVIALLRELQREAGATVICATHDDKMAAAADRIVRLSDGLVVAG